MEEQGPAGGAERQIAKLVEDDEIGVGEPAQGLPFVELRHEFAERGVDVSEAGEGGRHHSVTRGGIIQELGGGFLRNQHLGRAHVQRGLFGGRMIATRQC